MIREINRSEIPECVALIRESFLTVANEFNFTQANAPRFTAFPQITINYIGSMITKIEKCLLSSLTVKLSATIHCCF